MLAGLLLTVVVALMSGCILVPVGPPVVAEPAVVVPGPVIVAPGHRRQGGHHGYYHGGYRGGYGRYR
jgi:hypothetical protein